jgi:ATP-dependent DNA helicase RecG
MDNPDYAGITDSGEILGVNESAIESLLKNFSNTVNNPHQQLNPTSYFSPEIIDMDGKKVINIYVPESSQVHRYKNRIYDRIGDADNDITLDHSLIDNLYLRKRNDFMENKVCPFLTIDDLSSATFDKARHLASVSDPSHPWLSLSNEEIIRAAGFWRKDRATGKEGYILACALLFGTEVTVLTYCPAYRTDAIYRNMGYQRFLHPKSTDPDIRYDDRDDVRANLIESYLRLTSFVQKHLPDRFMLEETGIQRIDLRNKIFREIIANLLAHREYNSSFPAKLLVFSDIMVTENWTKPQQTGAVTLANLETHPKNPMIAKIFRELGWVEELGSGRKNIQKYAPLYYPDYKVEIQNQEKFVLSISYTNLESDLTSMDKPQPELQPQLQYEFDIEALYNELGSKLGLSRDQVGTKSTPSWHQVEKLLDFAVKPCTINEIMRVMEWKNRTKFRDKYMKPLIENGIINMTIPDKPQSSKQQYYLSEKGKAFLTGLMNTE